MGHYIKSTGVLCSVIIILSGCGVGGPGNNPVTIDLPPPMTEPEQDNTTEQNDEQVSTGSSGGGGGGGGGGSTSSNINSMIDYGDWIENTIGHRLTYKEEGEYKFSLPRGNTKIESLAFIRATYNGILAGKFVKADRRATGSIELKLGSTDVQFIPNPGNCPNTCYDLTVTPSIPGIPQMKGEVTKFSNSPSGWVIYAEGVSTDGGISAWSSGYFRNQGGAIVGTVDARESNGGGLYFHGAFAAQK